MIEPRIIFENDDLLVVDKPAGLSVHSEDSDPSGTLVEWFLSYIPKAQGVGEPRLGREGKEIERSGIVHRLDRDTSGVMVLAKKQETFLFLKSQFKQRLIRKEYRALVYGTMKERWGTIDRSIGRSASDFRKRSAEKGAKGVLRDSVTNWETIGSGTYQNEAFSYLKLLPKTGRMHQLRVHLKAIDRPIVGDRLYAESKIKESNNLGLERLALHSHQLDIKLPNGEVERFVSPIPQEMIEAVDRLTQS